MIDVKRPLEEATPLPWIGETVLAERGGTSSRITDEEGRIVALADEPDRALIVYAVNRLPDYEALVEAVVAYVAAEDEANRLADADDAEWLAACQAEKRESDNLRAALRRLHDEEPAEQMRAALTGGES